MSSPRATTAKAKQLTNAPSKCDARVAVIPSVLAEAVRFASRTGAGLKAFSVRFADVRRASGAHASNDSIKRWSSIPFVDAFALCGVAITSDGGRNPHG